MSQIKASKATRMFLAVVLTITYVIPCSAFGEEDMNVASSVTPKPIPYVGAPTISLRETDEYLIPDDLPGPYLNDTHIREILEPDFQPRPTDDREIIMKLLGEPTVMNAACLWLRFKVLGVERMSRLYDIPILIDVTEEMILDVFDDIFREGEMTEINRLFRAMMRVVALMNEMGGVTPDNAALVLHHTLTLGYGQNDLTYDFTGTEGVWSTHPPIVELDDVLVVLDTLACLFTEEELAYIRERLNRLQNDTPTVIEKILPSPGSMVTNPYPKFHASAHDISGLARYELRLDGVVVAEDVLSGPSAEISPYKPAAPVGDGPHEYTLKVVDALGFDTSASTSFSVRMTPKIRPVAARIKSLRTRV